MNDITLKVGGKDRGYCWGKNALERYMKKRDFKPEVDITKELDNSFASDQTALFLFCGLGMYCFKHSIPEDFTFSDCVEWAEWMTVEEQAKMFAAIDESKWQKHFNESVKKNEKELSELLQKSGGILEGVS